MAPLSFHVEALLPSSIAPKLDSLLHAHVYPQVAGVLRAVARLKALLLNAIDDLNNNSGGKKNRRRRSKMAGKFFTARAARRVDLLPDARCPSYHDECSAWNAAWEEQVEATGDGGTEAECGYLCWLEEEEKPSGDGDGEEGDGEEEVGNEIDRLAEKFIARFHAKCLLEKQESYRRRHTFLPSPSIHEETNPNPWQWDRSQYMIHHAS